MSEVLSEKMPGVPSSLLIPTLHRSEIIGFLAGMGTTFAAVPDLYAMLKRRSSAGMNPMMATIMGLFQCSSTSSPSASTGTLFVDSH